MRRLAAALAALAGLSCGLVGVCESEPDRMAAVARVETPHGGAETPTGGGSAWQGGDADGSGETEAAGQVLMPGVAAYEKMNIFERPDYESPRIGYVRRGTVVEVRGPIAGPDCGENGQKWFQLDEGGYVCSGRGLLLGAPLSQYLYAPPPPDRSATVPYRYAHVRRDRTPVFKRVPTREERAAVMEFLFPPPEPSDAGEEGGTGVPLEDEDAGTTAEGPVAEPPVADDLGDLGEGRSEVAGEPLEPSPETIPEPPRDDPDAGAAPPAEIADAGEEAEDAGMSEADLELLQRGPRHEMLVRVLMSGFTVAIAGSESVENHLWYRTVDGGYVDSADVSQIRIDVALEGMVLSGGVTLPVGFVAGRNTRLYSQNDRGEIVAEGALGRFSKFQIVGTEERGDRVMYRTADGHFVSRGAAVVVIEKIAPPRAVQEWGKWIVVDLTHQTLTAYEGEVPVFATLVSTGREGFETPMGTFRILAKHISNPMDDFTLGEPYAIDEVPYTMYFQQNVALHGAFWHRGFGNVRSHGCVNLSTPDAKWLFDWTAPMVPEGWHGVYATDSNPGTIVWVRKPRDRQD